MLVPQTEIIVSHGGTEVSRHVLAPGEYVLGREPGVDVLVDVPLVSRRHARLTIDYSELFIADLGSSNGTFLNGQPVTENTRVFPSQKITIGEATVELRRVPTGGTLPGSIMGTPAYMSPEQARGEVETLDARSAIYALGAILFELLHLRPAYTGRAALEIVDKVGRGEVEWVAHAPSRAVSGAPAGERAQAASAPPAELAAAGRGRPPQHARARALPASLLAVCRKALAPDAAARYPRVEDLQADLLAYQTGFATSAENAGAWKQATLFVKRHKAVATSIAAALSVLAVVVGVAFVRIAGEKDRAENALTDLKKTAPALRQLAETEAGFQRFDSALEKIDASIALAPEHLPAYWRRAWLLLGMERFADAAAAIREAQQREPSATQLAAILPVVEKLATAPSETERWASASVPDLYRHLEKVGANGEIAALSKHMQIGTQEKVKLIGARLRAWLGPGQGAVRAEVAGGIVVDSLPSFVSTIEPLRGLPIDHLAIGGTQVQSLEPLRGMTSLRWLSIGGCPIDDLAPLRELQLRHLLSTA